MMEGPFSIARLFFLDEAHRFETRLHRAEDLQEFILWWLYAASGGVDNLSHRAEQRLEEGGLSPCISHHIPRVRGWIVALPVLSANRYQKCW